MQRRRQIVHRICGLLLCFTILSLPGWGLGTRVIFAQENGNAAAETPPAAADQDAPQVSDAEVKAVAQDLWCPLCSGVRLDTCELKACEQMRQEIAIQLAEGKSPESIKAYFLDQYGPQVLGEPPRQGFNLLAWIVPFAVLVGAAGILLFRSRRLLSQRMAAQTADEGWDEDLWEDDLEPLPDDEPMDLPDDLPDEAHIGQNGEPAESYERALDEELRQYE